MGKDGVQPRVLNGLAVDLCVPISIMFNSSLQECVLPNEWLKSIFDPIYKKSVGCDPLNYRPISPTSVICKIMEKIIDEHMIDHLNENSLLSGQQFSFRSGYSTDDSYS